MSKGMRRATVVLSTSSARRRRTTEWHHWALCADANRPDDNCCTSAPRSNGLPQHFGRRPYRTRQMRPADPRLQLSLLRSFASSYPQTALPERASMRSVAYLGVPVLNPTSAGPAFLEDIDCAAVVPTTQELSWV